MSENRCFGVKNAGLGPRGPPGGPGDVFLRFRAGGWEGKGDAGVGAMHGARGRRGREVGPGKKLISDRPGGGAANAAEPRPWTMTPPPPLKGNQEIEF